MCVSDNFAASEHYSKIFYYARNNLQKDIQLVVLGKSLDWKETEMGMHVSTDVRNCAIVMLILLFII